MTVYSNAPVLFETVSGVTATMGANDAEIGSIAIVGDEVYRKVYNAGNSQVSPGYLVTVSAVTGYSVTVSSVTAADLVLGVCKHATLTTGTYGWVMSRGFGPAQMGANDSCASGQLLTVGVDGTHALKSNSTNHQGNGFAKVMAAAASGASAYAYFSIY
jgi:hypothetical protein